MIERSGADRDSPSVPPENVSPPPPPGSRLKEVFGGALDHAPGAGRAAYLDRACAGDPALRHQVEALLGSFDAASRFLGSAPAASPGEGSRPLDGSGGPAVVFGKPNAAVSTAEAGVGPGVEGPGTVIGPYKLLQQIGQGGMGTVYMAEQDRPVRRKVALKLIRAGMDSAQVIARFEAERQALAMMDHAQIARVLDAGTTATGRPFFVMELVRGVPITEYCDRNHLTPEERLRLFIPVCRAIQHAHQKGIIHRDIKPSNVLVTLHDGVPEPKVIDFGVAKAIDQRLTERTMFTEFGAIVGTLEYMSPEQAEMGALDIDTRSDIYSLGVLLYELLTGSTPLERARVRDAAYSEVLRRIREEEPPRPSTRLSGSKATLPMISAQRKTEPERLSRLVRGELDWIVMKALEKDRTRRYDSPASFARDIQRHIDGEAVEACPPSTTYRLRKFARKNRAALTTAVAFVALLVTATVVSTGLAVWALRAEQRANRNQARSKADAVTAVDAVERIVNVIRTTRELQVSAALAPLRATLLAEPRSFFQSLYERLDRDRDSSLDSIARLAAASYELGILTDETGARDDALQMFGKSLRLWEKLLLLNGADRAYQYEAARSAFEGAAILESKGEDEAALRLLVRARSLQEGLVAANFAPARSKSDLGRTLHAIGQVGIKLERPAEALAAFEEALPIWQGLIAADRGDIRYQGDLTWCLTRIGDLRPDRGCLDAAIEAYAKTRPLREELVSRDPTSIWHALDLAGNQANMGELQDRLGRPAEALATFQANEPRWRHMVALDPLNTRYPREIAWYETRIGEVQQELGDLAAAERSYLDAQADWARLHKLQDDNPEFAAGLARCLLRLAGLDSRAGRPRDAQVRLAEASQLLRGVLAGNSRHDKSLAIYPRVLEELVQAAERSDRPDEAAAARRELDQFTTRSRSRPPAGKN